MINRIASQSLPASWPERAAFEVANRVVCFADVVRAAAVRGDLQPSLEATRIALASEARAVGEGRAADSEAVEAAMDAFRYERNLVTAEETEQWLAAHGLGEEQFGDHFLRRYWKSRSDGSGDGEPVDPSRFAAAWAADLVFSGTFSRLARRSAREWLGTKSPPGDSPDPEMLREALRRRLGLDPEAFSRWRRDWAMDDAALDPVLLAQHRASAAEQELLSPGRRAAALAGLRHSLMHVDLLVSEFDSEAAAQEAYLCVTADGMTLESVALEAGYAVRTESGPVHRFPEHWQRRLVHAVPGQNLPPLALDGVHWVCRVLRQVEPELSEPSVAAAVDGVLLDQHFARREGSEIRWRFPVEGPT